jgi:hypothetical protein
MAAGLIDKGFYRWIARKYALGTRHRRGFPNLFYLLPWSHREQKSPLRSQVLNTYQPTMLRQFFNRSFHFHYHLHFKFDLFFRTYNTYYYSISQARQQKHTREAVIMPRGVGPGTQTAEFPETRDILTLLTMTAKEKESSLGPIVPMSFFTAQEPGSIYLQREQEVQGVPVSGKPGISILPMPYSMGPMYSTPAMQAIQQTYIHHQSMPPAARNLFEKTPLRGEAFAERCRRTMLPTTYSLLEYYKYRTVRCFLDFQKLFIQGPSLYHAYLPDPPSVPLSFSPFLFFLRAPLRSSRLTKFPFRSFVERLMSVPSVPHPRETVRVPLGTIPGMQTAALPESPAILTLLTMVANEKENGPGTFIPMSLLTAGEPGRIHFTREKQGVQGEQEVHGVPVPGKPGVSILPTRHIMSKMEAVHSLQTKQSIYKRHLFHPIYLMQRGYHIYPMNSAHSTHPLYSTHAMHPLQLLHLPHSLQQAAASFSSTVTVPGSMQTAVEDELTSSAPPIWPGAEIISMLESYKPLIPITLLKPLSTLRTTRLATSAPIETQKASRAAPGTGTPPILLRTARSAIPAAAAEPGARTVPIAQITSIPIAPLTALTTRRAARTPGAEGALQNSFTFPAVSTVPAMQTVPTSPIPTSIPPYGERPPGQEFKFDYPGALMRSGTSLEYFNPTRMFRPPSAQAAPLDDIGRKSVPGMPRRDMDHLTHESKNVSIHPDSQGISQQMNLNQLTDRVYRMLERKIRMERERRGW